MPATIEPQQVLSAAVEGSRTPGLQYRVVNSAGTVFHAELGLADIRRRIPMGSSKQRIFIGSNSSEKLKIARAIASDLSVDHEPTVWNEGIFDLSKDVLSGLIDRLDHSDTAVR